ncbi:hypothetical protein KFL_003350170 [Klebsormidium nitens]|uniref:Trichome birefringence-like N-terminal domain-containing protein n=1 Tax=Klebsormidium nitens TaxID=105231 RepID=A0A0U9HL50_KLENI|nr:hypothetical protein KFL_003350170 [Klebsormidium nitens]|eukprot:GAQ87167.1 hypothetical protein KFL_003350170 [Klebsormidium nitens]
MSILLAALAACLAFLLVNDGPHSGVTRLLTPNFCGDPVSRNQTTERAYPLDAVDRLYAIPTTAGSYIPGEMPCVSRSGRLQHGVLASCITASGDGASQATTNQETEFLIKIDPICAQYQAIDLTENTTTMFFHKAVDFATPFGEGDPNFLSQQTYFEGKEIKGSPFTVAVTGPSRPSQSSLRLCEGDDIGGPRGRWVLERPAPSSVPEADATTTRVSFLNATYTWQPLGCRLPVWECMNETTFKQCYGEHKFKLFLLGDSVMAMQTRELQKHYNSTGQCGRWLELEYTSLHGGLPVKIANASAAFESAAIHFEDANGAAAIWFNAGLHDLNHFCNPVGR